MQGGVRGIRFVFEITSSDDFCGMARFLHRLSGIITKGRLLRGYTAGAKLDCIGYTILVEWPSQSGEAEKYRMNSIKIILA